MHRTAPSTLGGNEFGRVALNAPAEATRGSAASATADEDVTANGDGGAAPAAPPAAPAPAPVGPPVAAPVAPPAPNCFVASGPTYTPSGAVPVTTAGGVKSAPFSFAATFGTAAATGRAPRCCSVRQFIKWNAAYAAWKGGPPHAGFGTAPADTWIEDRDPADKRYGHRAGVHSDPGAGFDEYTTGGVRDQANGDTYAGSDAPGGPAVVGGRARTGIWNFQLKVIDTCNGDAVKATSSIISIDWST